MRKILMLSVFAGAAALGIGAAVPAQAAPHTPVVMASTQPEAQVQQVQYRRHYVRRHYRHYRRHGRY